VDFPSYKIRVPEPTLSHRALQPTPKLGGITCNVTVRQLADGQSSCPGGSNRDAETIFGAGNQEVANEARAKMEKVAQTLESTVIE